MTSEVIIDGEVIQLPTDIVETPCLLKDMLSMSTWNNLSYQQQMNLHEMLPQSLSEEEKNDTVKTLFTGGNLMAFVPQKDSGNPIDELIIKLEGGTFSPEAYQIRRSQRKLMMVKKKFLTARHCHELLKEIIISRQCHLAATAYPELLRLSKHSRGSLDEKNESALQMELEERTEQMFSRVLSEVKQDVLCTSSTSFVEEDLASSDSDGETNRLTKRKANPACTVTPTRFKEMLLQHKRRRDANVNTPDLNINGIKLADVITRTFGNAKKIPGLLAKKRKHEESLKLAKQKKLKKKQTFGKAENKISSRNLSALHLKRSKTAEFESRFKTQPSCYFELVRDVLHLSSDKSSSSIKLLVCDWLSSAEASRYMWTTSRTDWNDLVESALEFMKTSNQASKLSHFEPVVQEHDGKWIWKEVSTPSEKENNVLQQMCKAWLEEVGKTIADSTPASAEGSSSFQAQERRRFLYSHQAFVYTIKGKRYTVPPVKGSNGPTKEGRVAREHCLLKSERPPQVTLLALTRDAVARLLGGRGTRAAVCSLLKESQYLAPIITDNQINAAVSGALDRLHYEPDPCVKFDASLRLWVYLHGERSIHDLERIHAEQLGAPKKKKEKIVRKSKEKSVNSNQKKKVVTSASNAIEAIKSQSAENQVGTTSASDSSCPVVENNPAILSSLQSDTSSPLIINEVSSSRVSKSRTSGTKKKYIKNQQALSLEEVRDSADNVLNNGAAKTIQLTQKQFLEMTRKLSKTTTPVVSDEFVVGSMESNASLEKSSAVTTHHHMVNKFSSVSQQQSQPSLKLILKPASGNQQRPIAELVRVIEPVPANTQRVQSSTKQQVHTVEALRRLSKQLSAVSSRPIKIVHQAQLVNGKSTAASFTPAGSRIINITTQPDGKMSCLPTVTSNSFGTNCNVPVQIAIANNTGVIAGPTLTTSRVSDNNSLPSEGFQRTLHITANCKGEALLKRRQSRDQIIEVSRPQIVHVLRRPDAESYDTKSTDERAQTAENSLPLARNIQVIQGIPHTLQIVSGEKLQTVQVHHSQCINRIADAEKTQPSASSVSSSQFSLPIHMVTPKRTGSNL